MRGNEQKPTDYNKQSTAEKWSVARFERWVRVGTESYVLEGIGPSAFPEAAQFIVSRPSLPSAFKAFSEQLNAHNLDNLKQAIANVLASLEPRSKYVPVFEMLLAIAVSVSAYPVLGVLAARIGGGFFGEVEGSGRDGLFAMTVYSVARLAAPGRSDAKSCLRELAGSRNFGPAYAATILIALCEIDPYDLTEHLSIPGLRSSLKRQFELFDKNGSLKMKLASRIQGILGIETLIETLTRLDILDPNFVKPSPDDWLGESLLFDSRSPLKLKFDDNDIIISLRRDKEMVVRLKKVNEKGFRPTGIAFGGSLDFIEPVPLNRAAPSELIEEGRKRVNYLFGSEQTDPAGLEWSQ